jgi:hypothetical protein
MFAWLAKSVLGSVLGHGVVYLVIAVGAWYGGYMHATRVDVGRVERTVKLMADIRAMGAEIEQAHIEKITRLEDQLGGYKLDDKRHRKEIDALKRIKAKGCILSNEELQAHPVSPELRDGFIGRVRK